MSNLVTDVLRELKVGYMTDTTLLCQDGTKLLFHRFILGARSEVFKKMFETNMKEKNTGIVEIKDFGSDVVSEFQEFLYSDLVQDNSPNLCDLLKIGHLYRVQLLVDLCANLLLTKVNRENVIEIANMAEKYDLVGLTDCCINILAVELEHLSIEQLNKLTPALVVKSISKYASIQPIEVNFFTGVGELELFKTENSLSRSTCASIESSKDMKLTGVGLHLGEYNGQVKITVEEVAEKHFMTVMEMSTDVISDGSTTTHTIINIPSVVFRKNCTYWVNIQFNTDVIRYKPTGMKDSVSVITSTCEKVTVRCYSHGCDIPIIYLIDS